MNSIVSDPIPKNTKFFAMYYDGSGGKVFLTDKKGRLIDHNGNIIDDEPETYLADCCFAFWVELPKDFKLWFENSDCKKSKST